MEEQTTIVGRPTYMAMFPGTQEAGPIVEKLVALGYPQDDITILLRPPGSDSAVDLLSRENAAGQDSDAVAAIAKLGDKRADACTIVILHPEPGQLDAVRAALNGMGAQEFGYEPQTVYTGAQSEADFAQSTVGSVTVPTNAGIEGLGATATNATAGKDNATKPGQFHPSPANATADAPPAGTQATAAGSGSAQGTGTTGGAANTPGGSAATGSAASTSAAGSSTGSTGSQPAHADTDDLKAEIRDLVRQVDHVRDELEKRD